MSHSLNGSISSQSMSAALEAAMHVSQSRLWQRHMEMAAIGDIGGGGVNRQALSDGDIKARDLLIRWAQERGYEISVDAIANLFVRREGNNPDKAPTLMGSHMDSQPRGGRFDGIYGVLAGLEVLDALDTAGIKTDRVLETVAWTNEEGGRFSPGAMGSTFFAGLKSADEFADIVDADGVRFADALSRTLAATPNLRRRDANDPPVFYLEAHIEQGPVLENAGVVIGIVNSIQGVRWFNIEIVGQGGHAGTTPAALRADPVQEAVAIITEFQSQFYDPAGDLRFTVGRINVIPNSPNSIASRVSFSVDLRHPNANDLADHARFVNSVCGSRSDKFSITVTETMRHDPCAFDSKIIDVIHQAANELDLSHQFLSSGAFHDALFVANVCPAGMIFVPCEKGISHDPAENAKPEHLAAGARVLTAVATVLSLEN